MSRDGPIAATADWIEAVVVGHNFCPFAKRELRRNSVRYALAEGGAQAALAAVLAECRHLDADAGTETTLLILPDGFEDFEDYLDLTAMAEDLLAEHGYEGVYQVASFHPDYRFEDADAADAGNYTNRSPHPMLHLLREDSLSRAIDAYPDVDAIPETNVAKARALGAAHWQALLEPLRR